MYFSIILGLLTVTTFAYNLSDYRLPTYAKPELYNLNVDLRYPERDTFVAQSWIDLNVTEQDVYEMVLNLNTENINMSTFDLEVDTADFICDIADLNETTHLIAFSCMWDLFTNYSKPTQFIMSYTLKYADRVGGVYKSKFNVNGQEDYVIFTDFEPTKFRKVFASLDEPNLKSNFHLRVDHYSNLTVVSNMGTIDQSLGGSIFEGTPLMSTYLLAFAAGPTETWKIYYSPYKAAFNFSIFAQRIYENYVSVALENGPKIIEHLGNWTGLPYESLGNPKMTYAGLPGMGGAMENWGLIIFDHGYLVDEGVKTSKRVLRPNLMVMAHETAHQWFGDYVTLDWWSDVWLNEGFATYFQYYIANLLSEEYEYDKLFLIDAIQPALRDDGLDATPISNNDSSIITEDQISAKFNFVSYQKGGSVIRMVRNALGEEVFRKGIQNYLKDKGLGNAKAADLVNHLQAVVPENDQNINMSTYLDSWLHQPGYPYLKTSVISGANNTTVLHIDIYKFAKEANSTKEPEPSIWWVPLTYATNLAPNWTDATTYWIAPGESFEFPIQNDNDSWEVINVQVNGYYRVDYDNITLAKIINVLNNSKTYNQIPVLNRAQILDDLFNVAKYSTSSEDASPYLNAFSAAQYLRHETEYYPWYSFLREVQLLLNHVQNETTKQALEENVLNLVTAQLIIPDAIDYNVSIPEVYKRDLLLDWACKLGHEGCLEYVKPHFTNYLRKRNKGLDNNYRDVILCRGLANSENVRKDSATLTNLYQSSISPHEQLDIALALLCPYDIELANAFLNSTLQDNCPIEKPHWMPMFKALYNRGPESLDVALRFVVGNVEAINEKWNNVATVPEILTMLASEITRQDHIKLLKNLLKRRPSESALDKALTSVFKAIERNAKWSEISDHELSTILM